MFETTNPSNESMTTDAQQMPSTTTTTSPTTESAPGGGKPAPIDLDPAARFRGPGTSFKAKLIGIDDVPESRGDKMCQDSILKLKAAVKASGQHKPKIMVNVSLKGIRIINLMTGDVEHEHSVHRISFIARDLTDRRAFGYIFGAGEGKHKFFGIKTAKIAEHLVLALRDLFQVVYDQKKKEMEEAKKRQAENGDAVVAANTEEVYAVPNSRPAPRAQQQSDLLNIQQQLDTMTEIRASDAFNPWPESAPISPDTPGAPLDSSDMFGMANLSDISSLSSDFSLASASSAAPDLRQGDPAKVFRSDSRTDHFRRSSSGKSVTSWNGSAGAHHWPGFRSSRKKRQGSMSGSNDSRESNCTDNKALERTPSLGATSLASKTTEDNLTERSEPATREQSEADSTQNTEAQSAKREAREDSFFHEVMTATGLTARNAQKSAEGANSSNSTPDSPRPPNGEGVTATEVSGGSLSSVSSTSSKSATPKRTLSITNLFFSPKSEKRRSSGKSKVARRPSARSKPSPSSPCETQSAVPTSTEKSFPDEVPTSSWTGGARVHRTSSSSSAASVDRIPPIGKLSRGYSSTSVGSAPDHAPPATNERYHKERVPPPVSIARARPKALSSLSMRATSSDTRNPPMFKFRHQMSADNLLEARALRKQNSVSSLDSVQSLHSLNSPSSTIVEQNEGAASGRSTGDAATCQSWANFDDAPSTQDFDNAKNRKPAAEPSAAVPPDSVWTPSGRVPDRSISESKDDATEPNMFQDSFSAAFADPFAAPSFCEADSSEKSPFDGTDPFGDIELEDPLADPLKDVEELFGPMLAPQSTDVENDNARRGNEHLTHTQQRFLANSRPETPQNLAPSAAQCDGFSSDVPSVHSSAEAESDSSRESGQSQTLGADFPVSFPPPLPPRPARRVPSPEEVADTPPPIIPPPPPPRPSGTDNSNPATAEDSSDDDSVPSERYSLPPDSQPPELPPPSALPPPLADRAGPPVPCRNLPKVNCEGNSPKVDYEEVPSHAVVPPIPNLASDDTEDRKNDANNKPMPAPRNSFADELADAFSAEAAQPAPAPGAKMTKDQILAGFGTAPNPMAGPQTGMYHQQQPQAFGVQPGYGMSAQTGMSNPFNSGFASNSPAFLGNQPAYGQPPMGMFPSGPSPAVPARPGAMRPPVNTAVQTGAAQNPFGDAFGSGMGVMAPQSNSSSLVNGSASVEEKKEKSDPFANLLPGIGSGAGSTTNKKDMFKNFQMAKPAPPPRSSDNVSANFEDYMRNSVGGVPLQTDDSNNNPPPMAAPRSNLGMDPFGAPAPPPATTAPSNDPFAMFDLGASNTDQTFTFANQQNQQQQQQPPANTQQSLFG